VPQQVTRHSNASCAGAFVFIFVCAVSGCGGVAQNSHESSSAGGPATAGRGGDADPSGAAGSAAGAASDLAGADSDSVAGSASGGAGAAAGGGNTHDSERAIYADYLAQWLVARSEREPGEPIPPPDVAAPCFDCVNSRGLSHCAYPVGSDCAPSTACIERHCLDTESYPASLYDCVESCLPSDDLSCSAQWLTFVSCSVPACAAVCD